MVEAGARPPWVQCVSQGGPPGPFLKTPKKGSQLWFGEGAHYAPRAGLSPSAAPLSVPRAATGSSKDTLSCDGFKTQRHCQPCQELQVTQSGLTATLPLKREPHTSASCGQAPEGTRWGQLLHAVRAEPTAVPVCICPSHPLLTPLMRYSGRGT